MARAPIENFDKKLIQGHWPVLNLRSDLRTLQTTQIE